MILFLRYRPDQPEMREAKVIEHSRCSSDVTPIGRFDKNKDFIIVATHIKLTYLVLSELSASILGLKPLLELLLHRSISILFFQPGVRLSLRPHRQKSHR